MSTIVSDPIDKICPTNGNANGPASNVEITNGKSNGSNGVTNGKLRENGVKELDMYVFQLI